jgi:broad specificity phosphatase PhoE
MLTLVLTRHGLTPRSDPEQHLGQHLDLGLSDEGREQVAALAGRIARERFDRIVSSPLLRARETAEAIARGRSVESDPRLMEMDYGRWEGLTYAEIDEVDAAYRRSWEADPASLACPGGESGDDVAARAATFLADLLRWASGAGPDPVVLAVAHSTFNRILLCAAMEVPVREYRRRFTQAQVNVTALRYRDGAAAGQARLLVLNDLGHIRASDQAPWELRPGA